MQTFRLVLVDLWRFVLSEFSSDSAKKQLSENKEGDLISTTSMIVAPPLSLTGPVEVDGDVTFTPTQPASRIGSREELTSGQDAFILFPDTPCYLRPALVKDTVLGVFGYATKVKVVAQQADWVRITDGDIEGWTECSHLTQKETDVLPTFEVGAVYDADHPETLKLRTYISDEFGVVFLHTAALNSEYVWFKMLQQRTHFSWPPLRPRTPGRWSEILRPEPSVHISAVPLTGSIMEYMDKKNVAQLYFVESVTPEEAVTVNGFTGADNGEFISCTFTKDEWTSLRPRYIIKK